MEVWELRQRQSLPLEAKIKHSEKVIREWYEHWNGMVYVAFSGGKDSTVLLHLVRSMYPNVPAVFVDTGLEYPEIKEFVRSIQNVTIIRPKMNFKEVIETYGYPVISKKVAREIHDFQMPSEKNKASRIFYLTGRTRKGKKSSFHKLPIRFKHLINAPFKISDKCCEIMKKRPCREYEKETSRKPYLGMMATDGQMRETVYLKQGCNAFDNNKPTSWPLAIWTETDVWDYIHKFNIPYSKIYDMGVKRTGCIFCMFGAHLETPNRFQMMEKTHPQLYNYCMENLGLREVCKFCKIPYTTINQQSVLEGLE